MFISVVDRWGFSRVGVVQRLLLGGASAVPYFSKSFFRLVLLTVV
jgi:hypothetical protein